VKKRREVRTIQTATTIISHDWMYITVQEDGCWYCNW